MSGLKRTAGLRTKTRLARRTPLGRGAGLERTTRIPQQSAKKRATRRSWEEFRAAVLERSAGCCDLCGTWIRADDYECHHRRLRSQGGGHYMANLLALHKFPCHAYVHDNRAWAHERGFIVPLPGEPLFEPVLRRSGWALPDESWTPVDPEGLAA